MNAIQSEGNNFCSWFQSVPYSKEDPEFKVTLGYMVYIGELEQNRIKKLPLVARSTLDPFLSSMKYIYLKLAYFTDHLLNLTKSTSSKLSILTLTVTFYY